MKKIILICFVLLSLSNVLTAQSITFSDILTVNHKATSIAVQNDGKILIAGRKINPSGNFLARFNPDFTLDTTFNGSGEIVNPSVGLTVDVIKVFDDGKILAALPYLVKYNSDGTVDASFDASAINTTIGTIHDILLLPNGSILILGYKEGAIITKLFQNGGIDTSYGTMDTGSVEFSAIFYGYGVGKFLMKQNGDILFSINSGVSVHQSWTVRKISSFDGSWFYVTSMGGMGPLAHAKFRSFANLSDGRFVVSSVVGSNYPHDHYVYNEDLSPGGSFSPFTNGATKTKSTPDGKLMGIGNPSGNIRLLKMNYDGSADLNFGDNGLLLLSDLGVYQKVIDFEFSSDNKIAVIGEYEVAGDTRPFLYIISPEGGLDVDKNNSTNQPLFYPNPVTDKINFSQNIQSANLYATDGRLISSQVQNNQMDVSGLPNGLYLVRGLTKDNTTFSSKIIKN